MQSLVYKKNITLDQEEVTQLYIDSTLGERRPVHDKERMRKMLRYANLIITAWDNDLLVGIARTFTDYAFLTYVSDLAVRKAYQRKGIGKQLIVETLKVVGPDTTLHLAAAPDAKDYYEHIGFLKNDFAWKIPAKEKIQPDEMAQLKKILPF